MDIQEVLKDLTGAGGVSGAEYSAAEAAEKYLSRYGKVHTDALGSLICEIDGKGPHILLDAHIDRVGMIVTSVTEEGFLRVAACGGIDNRTLCAQQVTVHGVRDIKGVIISTPVHLQNGSDDKKAMKTDEAIIDIGMDYEKACEAVTPGDRVTVCSGFIPLAGDRISCHAFDDRAGMAAIIYALDILKNKECNQKITVSFSSLEETTEGGAAAASFSAEADEFIAVDVSFAATPDSKTYECGVLGKGPMIGVAPSLTREVSEKLKMLAAEKKIPYQLEIMGGKTGTNADVMSISGKGMKSGLISIPLRYMHTGVEVIALSDVENTAMLIADYILDGGVADA